MTVIFFIEHNIGLEWHQTGEMSCVTVHTSYNMCPTLIIHATYHAHAAEQRESSLYVLGGVDGSHTVCTVNRRQNSHQNELVCHAVARHRHIVARPDQNNPESALRRFTSSSGKLCIKSTCNNNTDAGLSPTCCDGNMTITPAVSPAWPVIRICAIQLVPLCQSTVRILGRKAWPPHIEHQGDSLQVDSRVQASYFSCSKKIPTHVFNDTYPKKTVCQHHTAFATCLWGLGFRLLHAINTHPFPHTHASDVNVSWLNELYIHQLLDNPRARLLPLPLWICPSNMTFVISSCRLALSTGNAVVIARRIRCISSSGK